jgi:hypothetical protein
MTTLNTGFSTEQQQLIEELRQWKEGDLKFPYELSTELLEYFAEKADGWKEMRARHELMIRKAGRSLVAVMKEDENGEYVMKDGKPVPEFVYTLGEGRKGFPELICFYPSSTIGHAINTLCDKMEAGEVTLDPQGVTKVPGCFENESLELLVTPLSEKARRASDEEYACQIEDSDALFLVIAPLPDGSYRHEFIADALLS